MKIVDLSAGIGYRSHSNDHCYEFLASQCPQAPPPPSAARRPSAFDPALDAERIATVAKALSEPVRVRILDVLRRNREPVCQCELIALFEIKQSLLSHHMRKLVDAGLVDVERRHKWAYYSVAADAFQELTAWLS